MKVHWTAKFEKQLDSEWFNRKVVVNTLIHRLEHAASLEELEDALTCETDKGCCIFNTTCKVLFTYDEAKNEAELIEYSFKITENGP